jgi:hypothetical protein
MFSTPDEISIKLHTAVDGKVWSAPGINPPRNSNQTPVDFLSSSALAQKGLHVRLLGVPQNAALIVELYARQSVGTIRAVEVAGPNRIRNYAAAAPADILLQMRTIAEAPACGGFHVLSQYDYPTYSLLFRQQAGNIGAGDPAAAVRSYLVMHPAAHALSFIPDLNMQAVTQLLTTVIDPRWYVDSRLPDRTSKLELFMGLTPQTQAVVSDAAAIVVRPREQRCATVLACWKTKDPATVDTTDPRNFLYRIYAAHGGGPKGDLRASQAFLRYVRHNWLDGLETRKGAKDGLFAPDLFFKTPVEVASYNLHMTEKKKPK